MTSIVELPIESWNPDADAALRARAQDALEGGNVLFFPRLGFPLDGPESLLLDPAMDLDAKNISFDPTRQELRGSPLDGADRDALQGLMNRFGQHSRTLVTRLLPAYDEKLVYGRTSFRPAEIRGRVTSWRKDDTRLHVDSFPSSPTQGKRILRVFANINPTGDVRTWKVGEPFESVARRFLPTLPAPLPGSPALLQALHITKSRRSAYDHYMLHLHDRMKRDTAYQAAAAQATHHFPAQSAWMVFTDQASHAALSGQFALEQTFYLPVPAMVQPERSPLGVLQRLLDRTLV